MKIWFDTEFIEDGKTIDLLSIGMVREDGKVLYFEPRECDRSRASDWVKSNVIPHLEGGGAIMSRQFIARQITMFAGETPEFWAYYADYDWVALCQLFGTMMDIPSGWPMYCRDVKQLCDDLGNPKLPEQTSTEHHAAADALWPKKAWEFLQNRTQQHGHLRAVVEQVKLELHHHDRLQLHPLQSQTQPGQDDRKALGDEEHYRGRYTHRASHIQHRRDPPEHGEDE